MEVVSLLSLKSLEGFHIRAARRMAGKMPTKNPDRTWTYPSSRDVLKAVGLQTIDHYIGARRIPSPASSWTDPYLRSVGMGTGRGDQRVAHFWWERPLSINVAESLPGDEEDESNDT